MNFLSGVNRILRATAVMGGDDSDIVSFSSNQHTATIQIARQAIQHVTNELIADRFLWPEDKQGIFTVAKGVREIALAPDFVRFRGTRPWLFEIENGDAQGRYLIEYPGGELQLQKDVFKYTSDEGTPQWYYFTADQMIGIYPIPDKSGILYRYEYQKDVMPETEPDSLPVQSEQMAYSYIDMAARIFTFMFSNQAIDVKDVVYNQAKAALMALQVKKAPIGRYGHRYGNRLYGNR